MADRRRCHSHAADGQMKLGGRQELLLWQSW